MFHARHLLLAPAILAGLLAGQLPAWALPYDPQAVLGTTAGGGELRVQDFLAWTNLDGVVLNFDADLRGADFTGKTLRGAILGSADCGGARFDGVDLSSTVVTLAKFHRASLAGATLRRADAWVFENQEVDLEGVVWVGDAPNLDLDRDLSSIMPPPNLYGPLAMPESSDLDLPPSSAGAGAQAWALEPQEPFPAPRAAPLGPDRPAAPDGQNRSAAAATAAPPDLPLARPRKRGRALDAAAQGKPGPAHGTPARPASRPGAGLPDVPGLPGADSKTVWWQAFTALKAFEAQRGHLRVGPEICIGNLVLGAWMCSQKSRLGRLAPDQVRALDSIPGWRAWLDQPAAEPPPLRPAPAGPYPAGEGEVVLGTFQDGRWLTVRDFGSTQNLDQFSFAPNAQLQGVDFTGKTLAGADLGNADCTRARLGGVDLRRTRLAGATLAGADFTGATLRPQDALDLTTRGIDVRGARFLEEAEAAAGEPEAEPQAKKARLPQEKVVIEVD